MFENILGAKDVRVNNKSKKKGKKSLSSWRLHSKVGGSENKWEHIISETESPLNSRFFIKMNDWDCSEKFFPGGFQWTPKEGSLWEKNIPGRKMSNLRSREKAREAAVLSRFSRS